MRTSAIACWLVVGLLGCGGESPALFGEPCIEAADCESGRCEDLGGVFGRACTADCTAGAACGTGTVCEPDLGYCTSPCAERSVTGSGESAEVCVSGLYQACSSQSDVSFCDVCGCAPFGGGTCIEGRGCVVPREDGATCEADFECAGGTCFRDTQTCGSPRAMGEPCRADAECETDNCSNEGDVATEGVCNQPLGSSCTRGSSTCSRCVISGFEVGVCSRDACDPTHAPNCPTAEGYRWECERTTEGGHACFQVCMPSGAFQCFDSTLICSDGYCQ